MSNKSIRNQYIYSRIMIIILFILTGTLNNSITELFKLFDAEHYFCIALNGYNKEMLYAFFPLFPLIIKAFSIISANELYLIISISLFNIAITYISSIYMYKLIDIYCLDEYKEIVFKIWLYSPVAFFTVIPYTESLFLFFTIISFYLYRKKEHYILMGVLIGLAVATRSMGSLLFFSIFIGMVVNKEQIMNIIKTYIPATIISCIYPGFLFIKTGSWNKFMTVQSTEWGRVKSNFIDVVVTDIKKFFNTDYFIVRIVIPIILLVLIFAFILMIIQVINDIRNRDISKLEMVLYLMFSLLVICSTKRVAEITTPSSVSMHRYVAGIFSIYLLLPQNKKILQCIYIISLIITIVTTICMGIGFFLG